jgi:hypothetical protein
VSDPAGKYPLGILARPAPDWFDDQLGVGKGSIFATGANQSIWFSVSLFNNAGSGQVLKVYGLSTVNVGIGGLDCFFASGPYGTFYTGCSANRPDVGAPYGQIYTQSQEVGVSSGNPYLLQPAIATLGTSGESFTYFAPFPIFIVPVGYSLVVCNVYGANNIAGALYAGGAGFWYQVANQ